MEIFFTILIMTLVVSLSGVVTAYCPSRSPPAFNANSYRCAAGVADVRLHVSSIRNCSSCCLSPRCCLPMAGKRRRANFWSTGERDLRPGAGAGGGHRGRVGFPDLLGRTGDPLIPAFALAAVLSPTDAVALSGIVGEGAFKRKSWAFCGRGADERRLWPGRPEVCRGGCHGHHGLTVGGAIGILQGGDWRYLAGFVVSWLYGRSLRSLAAGVAMNRRRRSSCCSCCRSPLT